MRLIAVLTAAAVILFGYLVAGWFLLIGVEPIIGRGKSPVDYLNNQCGYLESGSSAVYDACVTDARSASFFEPGAPDLPRGAVVLLATLALTWALILINRIAVTDEVDGMIARCRAEFDGHLAERALAFSMTTNVVFALRGFRRELYVVGGGKDDDHVWRWGLFDVDWLGRRRELMSLASVEQGVAGVLARYLAGQSPPWD